MSTSGQSETEYTAFYRFDGKESNDWEQLHAEHLEVSSKVTEIPEHFCHAYAPISLDLSGACDLRMIGRRAFQCPRLQMVSWPEKNCRRKYDENDGSVSPQLQELEEEAFQGCCSLREVVWSQLHHLVSIGGKCFHRCTSLETVKMAPNLSHIGARAFAYCHALREIQWNRVPLMQLEEELFAECSQLTHLNLTDMNGLRIIRPRVFKNCKGLERVQFPSTLESIGSGAFYGCESLTEVKFARDCTSQTKQLLIGQAAFAKCTSLTSFDMPNYVPTLAPLTFWECTKLETLKLPPNLESIGGSALGNCIVLQEVVFPPNMKQESIGPNAFFKCPFERGTDIWYWQHPRHENDYDQNIFDDGLLLPTCVTKVMVVVSGEHFFDSHAPIGHPKGEESLEWVDIQSNDLLSAIQLSNKFPRATASTISMDRLVRMYNSAPICWSDFCRTIKDRRKQFYSSSFRAILFCGGRDQEKRDILEKFGKIQLAHVNTIHQFACGQVGLDLPLLPFAFFLG
ncbi:MAG: hypothetical protein SGBAC_010477 [Bacillariaceae sp.]